MVLAEDGTAEGGTARPTNHCPGKGIQLVTEVGSIDFEEMTGSALVMGAGYTSYTALINARAKLEDCANQLEADLFASASLLSLNASSLVCHR